jgi:hypothetical protein
MEIGDQRILLCSPSPAAQVWVETIDPASTALPISAPWEKPGAPRPVRSAFTGNKINDRSVLFAGPWPSHQCRVKSSCPSPGNLPCRFARKKGQKLTASWQTALGVELKKKGILLRGPQGRSEPWRRRSRPRKRAFAPGLSWLKRGRGNRVLEGAFAGHSRGLRRTFDAVRLEQPHFQQTESMEILVLEGPLAARGPAWPAGRSLA